MDKIVHSSRSWLVALVCLALGNTLFAQTGVEGVSIGNYQQPPHESAILDVTSVSKGMLIPRMTLSQRGDLTLYTPPADGLLIYQTDDDRGFYYYDGDDATWKKVGSGAGSSLWQRVAGSTDDIENINTGNVGIGLSSGAAKGSLQIGDRFIVDDRNSSILWNAYYDGGVPKYLTTGSEWSYVMKYNEYNQLSLYVGDYGGVGAVAGSSVDLHKVITFWDSGLYFGDPQEQVEAPVIHWGSYHQVASSPGLTFQYRNEITNTIYLGPGVFRYRDSDDVNTIYSNNTFELYNGWYNGAVQNRCDLAVYGDVKAYSFITNSDSTLKDNIAPLSSALTNVTQLNAKTYNWKDEQLFEVPTPVDTLDMPSAYPYPTYSTNPEKQIGLIAQELETVYPELVSADSNGIKSIDYMGLVPVLIEAVKELKSLNDSLATRVYALENP